MRRVEEQEVLQRFSAFLKRTTGWTWALSADEGENPNNRRNYDSEFTSHGCRPIAVDVFRVYQAAVISKFKVAGVESSTNHGVGGLHITTPFPEKKHVDLRWYQKTAAAFSKAVARNPSAEVYEVDGVEARRCGGHEEPNFFSHGWMSMHQLIEAASQPPTTSYQQILAGSPQLEKPPPETRGPFHAFQQPDGRPHRKSGSEASR